MSKNNMLYTQPEHEEPPQGTGLAIPAILFLGLFILVLGFLFIKPKKQFKAVHQCGYRLCPMQGYEKFKSDLTECEPGSDCYILDSLHFANPAMNYDELDSMLFSPTK